MVALGMAITFISVGTLLAGFLYCRRRPLPAYGGAGLAVLVAAQVLMFRGVQPVSTYFTPIAWSAYLLLADAAVLAVSGRSRLHDTPGEFARMALLSVPLWLVFEGYNLRLENWTYVGVPMGWPQALLGYGWSFATITPAILETADLIESFGWFKRNAPVYFSATAERVMILVGAVCLIVPLVVPRHTAARLFALVWVGFIFLLDPINRRMNLPSLLEDFAAGRRSRFYSLMASGWACGWLWEFWNYWASAKWHYVFPIFQEWKIFEMPAPGYFGFLPFAVECFVMYVAANGLLARAGRWIAQAANRAREAGD